MPSQLRYSSSSPINKPASSTYKSISSPPQKKQKMSLTQTYYLAHTARGKLSKEASRADHDLRLLVGHANLLDGLMLDLADAEREQESWFNQTVKGAAKASEEPKHIQWAERIQEEADEDSDVESSDGESEYDEDEEIPSVKSQPSRRAPSPPVTVTSNEVEMESDEEMDDEDEDDLTLTRTSSHTPPELLHESDSESDDDSMPPSPPTIEMPLDAFSEKQRQAIATTSFYSQKPTESQSTDSFYEEGFYLPQRQVVSAY